jgi:hypothetical protein
MLARPLAVAALAVAALGIEAQDPLILHMTERPDVDYGPYVVQHVFAPPFHDIAAGPTTGQRLRYRALVLKGIVHPLLVLEEYAYASETSGIRLLSVKDVDLVAIAMHLDPDAAVREFRIVGAPAARRFVAELNGVRLEFEITDAQTLRVTPRPR